MEARTNVRRQIYRLQLKHAPFALDDPKATAANNDLIVKLTEVLREIDDSLAGLRGDDP
jgi:hypothetical protein